MHLLTALRGLVARHRHQLDHDCAELKELDAKRLAREERERFAHARVMERVHRLQTERAERDAATAAAAAAAGGDAARDSEYTVEFKGKWKGRLAVRGTERAAELCERVAQAGGLSVATLKLLHKGRCGRRVPRLCGLSLS